MNVDTQERKTLEQMSATDWQYANTQKDKRYLVKYLDLVQIQVEQ